MSRAFGDSAVARPVRRPPAQGAFAFLGAASAGVERFAVDQIDAEVLRDAVARWLGSGYAISLSLSSDGGALGVHLIVGGDKRTKWVQDVAAAEDFLQSVPGVPSA